MVFPSATLQVGDDPSPNDSVLGANNGRRSYTLFQGHSGPVYSATFSPFGDFILSSSSDSTSMSSLASTLLLVLLVSILLVMIFFLSFCYFSF